MGFLIFLIIVVIIIVRSKKLTETAAKNREQSSAQRQAAPVVRPQTAAQSQSARPVVKVPPVKTVSPEKEETMVESSTMDYLAEKAENEARSAEAGKYRMTGKVGRRMPDWGDIANGEMTVICTYCGAENILPRGSRRDAYTCYFCREKL